MENKKNINVEIKDDELYYYEEQFEDSLSPDVNKLKPWVINAKIGNGEVKYISVFPQKDSRINIPHLKFDTLKNIKEYALNCGADFLMYRTGHEIIMIYCGANKNMHFV